MIKLLYWWIIDLMHDFENFEAAMSRMANRELRRDVRPLMGG